MSTKELEIALTWRPGRVEAVDPPIKTSQRWAMVYDDGGELCARFKVGRDALQVCFDRIDRPYGQLHWQDATLMWPRFPAWVRGAVTQQLNLFGAVHVSRADA